MKVLNSFMLTGSSQIRESAETDVRPAHSSRAFKLSGMLFRWETWYRAAHSCCDIHSPDHMTWERLNKLTADRKLRDHNHILIMDKTITRSKMLIVGEDKIIKTPKASKNPIRVRFTLIHTRIKLWKRYFCSKHPVFKMLREHFIFIILQTLWKRHI